jgi:hypothetical protein
VGKYKQLTPEKKAEHRRRVAAWVERSAHNFITNRFIIAKPRIGSAPDTITCQYLIDLYGAQDGKCALSGLQMMHTLGNHASISIDRIDSKRGYLVGNVQLVCQFINLGKNRHTNDEVKAFLKEMRQ